MGALPSSMADLMIGSAVAARGAWPVWRRQTWRISFPAALQRLAAADSQGVAPAVWPCGGGGDCYNGAVAVSADGDGSTAGPSQRGTGQFEEGWT